MMKAVVIITKLQAAFLLGFQLGCTFWNNILFILHNLGGG